MDESSQISATSAGRALRSCDSASSRAPAESPSSIFGLEEELYDAFLAFFFLPEELAYAFFLTVFFSFFTCFRTVCLSAALTILAMLLIIFVFLFSYFFFFFATLFKTFAFRLFSRAFCAVAAAFTFAIFLFVAFFTALAAAFAAFFAATFFFAFFFTEMLPFVPHELHDFLHMIFIAGRWQCVAWSSLHIER